MVRPGERQSLVLFAQPVQREFVKLACFLDCPVISILVEEEDVTGRRQYPKTAQENETRGRQFHWSRQPQHSVITGGESRTSGDGE